MEQSFNYNKYSKFINVVQIIVKIIMIITAVFLALVLLGFVVSVFIPRALLEFDLSVLNNYSFRGINIINSLDPAILQSTINIKRSLMTGLFAGSLNIFFALYVLYHIQKLLKNVKTEPFNAKNGTVLRNLSIGFFAASFLLSVANGIFQNSVIQMIGFTNVDTHFGLNWQFIFMGVLILILGYIFNYGAYLQEEHD